MNDKRLPLHPRTGKCMVCMIESLQAECEKWELEYLIERMQKNDSSYVRGRVKVLSETYPQEEYDPALSSCNTTMGFRNKALENSDE